MKREKRSPAVRAAAALILLAGLLTNASSARAEEIRCFRAESALRGASEVFAADSSPIHILLIGQDRRPGQEGRRSDSIILCSFCPEKCTLVLTSVMRDLYVEIPGRGKNRINAAYAFGGRELLDRTLEQNLGIAVDGNIEVDFDQFPRVIDLLGGVPLELRQDEAAEINRLVPGSALCSGRATLTGAQTLVYSRIRKLDADSDFSRTQRQRKVLQSLLNRYREITLPTALKLLSALLPMVDTDLGYLEIMTCCRMILPVLGELQIVSQRIPSAGECREAEVDGMSVLSPDLPAIRKKLNASLGQ